MCEIADDRLDPPDVVPVVRVSPRPSAGLGLHLMALHRGPCALDQGPEVVVLGDLPGSNHWWRSGGAHPCASYRQWAVRHRPAGCRHPTCPRQCSVRRKVDGCSSAPPANAQAMRWLAQSWSSRSISLSALFLCVSSVTLANADRAAAAAVTASPPYNAARRSPVSSISADTAIAEPARRVTPPLSASLRGRSRRLCRLRERIAAGQSARWASLPTQSSTRVRSPSLREWCRAIWSVDRATRYPR